jgi:hypothetical protein
MMQFKYPSIFYLLIVLIIPLIIHLFNLQKFKKIAFSNVQFLKKVKLESRKSSKIKKFIILALRIISFLALLFTFSQPYYSDKKINESIHNFIYLDNSMSLNTNDQNGNKLNEAIQEIIQFAPKKETYSLLTNDEFLSNISKEEVNIYLKKLNFSTKNSYFGDKIRTLESKINNETNELNKIILITDFQQFNKNKNFKFTNVNTPLYLKKPDLKKKNNISIDSVFIKTNDRKGNLISVVIKNQGEEKTDIPIALFNASNLLNKQSFSIKKDRKKTIEFPVESLEKIKGKIEITYNDVFLFDNIFYFTLDTPQKTSILTIGKKSTFLSKIFTKDDFILTNSSTDQINFNIIPSQQLIILNQLQNISDILKNSLQQFIKGGGHLLIIPANNIDISSYNTFLKIFNKGSIRKNSIDTLKITDINFEHPIFNNVFSKKVTNFQYPFVTQFYNHNFSGSTILSFQNKSSFLKEINNSFSKIYLFSSPLDKKSTNFFNSPLIVPILFNIGKHSLEIDKPYYILQEQNRLEINKKINKNQLIKFSNSKNSFIPQQKTSSNKISLFTNKEPKERGFYTVTLENDTLKTTAFNISPKESFLSFQNLDNIQNKNIFTYDSVKELFTEINEKNKVQWLWRLFLGIAIVSLLLEILILKFFKT